MHTNPIALFPFWRNVGLRGQLAVAFGLLSLLVAAVAGVALWGIASIRASAHQAVAVDSQVAQGLLAVVQAARLVGAEAVLVGVRPEVAQTMVGLGLSLAGLHTCADLQTAIGRLTGVGS